MQRQGLALERPGTSARDAAVSITAAGWLLGVATTALVVGTPLLVPAYRNPDLHLVLDTADTCVALLLAYLVHGRFRRSGRLQDLLLSQALALLALAGVGMSLLLGVLRGYDTGTVDVWLPVGLRACAAVLVLLAALAGDRQVRGWVRRARALPWGLVAVAFVLLWLLRDHLPVAVREDVAEAAVRPVLTAHPFLFAAWALAAVCFLLASVVFTRRLATQEDGRPDHLLRAVGPAFALAGFARVNYLLFPSLYSGWLYTGDLLRTASYVVLLVGAAREIRDYWSARARVAVLEDRRRLARELHDGVVQELAYIRIEGSALTGDPRAKEGIVTACDRALDEARAAVDALGRSADEPLGVVLQRAARQVAERYGADLEPDLDPTVPADPEHRHDLVRITREAVSNAIRHGGTPRVVLRLRHDHDGRRRLSVIDEGNGFDPVEAQRTGTGYGLVGLRARAAAIGGSVEIRSEPGRGTTVEVTW